MPNEIAGTSSASRPHGSAAVSAPRRSTSDFSDTASAWPGQFAQPQYPEQAVDETKAIRLTYPRLGQEEYPEGWIGVILYAPYYQPEQWGIPMPNPPTAQQAQLDVEVLLEEAFGGGFDLLTPVNPNRLGESLAFICFSSILNSEASSGVATLIDATQVGGHYFPTILARVLTYEQLATFVRPLLRYGIEDFQFAVGSGPVEHGPGSTFILNHGDVVTVAGPTSARPTAITHDDVLNSDNELSPLHQVWMNIRTPCICLWHQGRRYILDQCFQDGRNITETVSFMLDIEEAQWIACASHHFHNLDVQGTACDRLLAVFQLQPVSSDNPLTKGRRDIWVFCDFRPLGHRPHAVLTHVYRIHVPSLLALCAVQMPDGFDLDIKGGVRCGEEVLIGQYNTLVFQATPIWDVLDEEGEPEDGPPHAPPPDSGSSSHGSPDNSRDPPDEAPGSSHGPEARRSRSPRRTGDEEGPNAAVSGLEHLLHDKVLPYTSKSPAWKPCVETHLLCGYCNSPQLLSATAPAVGQFIRAWTGFDLLAHEGTLRAHFFGFLSHGPKSAKGPPGPDLHSAATRVDRAAQQGLELTYAELPVPYAVPDPVLTAPLQEDEEQNATPEPFIDVRCLIYAPEYIPDLLLAPVTIPCSVEHLSSIFADVRDASQAECFPHIFPATPQPDRRCAIYTAVPSWVTDKVVVLFHLQTEQDCLFAAAVHPRLNKASLLWIAEIRNPADFSVYVHGLTQPLPPDLWIDLQHGFTIAIVAAESGPPPGWCLHDMLQDREGWDHTADVPGPGGSPGEWFWVLSDGLPFRFRVQAGRRRNAKADIFDALQYQHWRSVLKPSAPRIIDHLSRGYISSGLLVATEQMQCIPFPPARQPERRKILILDCRALLKGFMWRFFTGEHVVLQHLADVFADYCPNTHLVVFKGADILHTEDGLCAKVAHGTVLKVEFQEEETAAEDSSHNPSSLDDNADPDAHDGMPQEQTADVNTPQLDPLPDEDRSRSPRTHSSHAGQGGGRDDSSNDREAPVEVTTAFAILVPGYQVESVTVTIQLPTTISEVLPAVQSNRTSEHAADFPDLHPTTRQPDACWGLLVAATPWRPWGPTIGFCVYAGRLRVFAEVCPAVVNRAILLAIAGLVTQPDIDVYCDSDVPLTESDNCEVRSGSCVTITDQGCPLPWTMSLRAMLLTHLPWDVAPAYPVYDQEDLFLLACTHGNELFTLLPQRACQYRQDIAEVARCPPSVLLTAPAAPKQENVAVYGQPCRTVIAAVGKGHCSSQEQPCVGLLDARRIYRGWLPLLSVDGWINIWSLLRDLGGEIPWGWCLAVAEHPRDQKWVYIAQGTVLTVICRPYPQRVRPEATESYGQPHDIEETQADSPSHAPTDQPVADPERPPNQYSGDSGLGGHNQGGNRVRFLVGCVALGLGEAHSLDLPEHPDGSSPHVWSTSFFANAFAEGRRYLTTDCIWKILGAREVIIIVLICATAGALFPHLRKNKGYGFSGNQRLLHAIWYICLLQAFSPCGAMPNLVQPRQHEPCEISQLPSTHRPLPTPCRIGRSSLPLPHFSAASVSNDTTPCLEFGELNTLLEQSVQTDKTPFLLAATLLETLHEHISEGASCQPDSLTQAESLQSDWALQTNHSSAREADRTTIHIYPAIGPEVFDLTAHTVELPHKPAEVIAMTHVWQPTWLAPDLAELSLPEHTVELVNSWMPWPAFLANLPCEARPILHMYTDGSWTEVQQVGGYAVLLVLEWQNSFTVFGTIGEHTHGSANCVWPLEGPPALRNEEIAITAALLWLAQSPGICKIAQALVHYDCLGAGHAATGEWNPGSPFASRLRDTQRWLDVFLDAPIQYRHVKAHNGHPLNDAVDALAKQVSQGNIVLGSPPPTCVAAVCDADLSWLATAYRPDANTALPLRGTFAMQWGSRQFATSSPLAPDELVPTQPILAGGIQGEDKRFELCAISLNVQGFGGQHKYIEDQLEPSQCNIVFFQETKTAESLCHSKAFLRLHTDAKKHWGTSIWISRTRGVCYCNGRPCHVRETDIHIVLESERLLILTLQVGELKITAFSAHCPHSGRRSEADKFLAQLHQALHPHRHSTIIVGGIDLNGRPPLHVASTTGDLDFGDDDETGTIATKFFADLGLWLPSTFSRLHTGESYTYRHPSGAEHRIDFILLGGRNHVREAHSQVLYDFDTGSVGEDHHPVQCHVIGSLGPCAGDRKLRRTKYDVTAMLTTEGKRQIAEAMTKYVSPAWYVHPDEHCKHLTEYLQKVMEEHFTLSEYRPRATYIPDEIWTLRDAKIALRRRTRHRKQFWHDLYARAFQQWRRQESYAVVPLIQRHSILYQITSAAIKFATARIKRGIRLAKTDYLRNLVHVQGDRASDVLQKAKQAGIGGKKSQSPFRPFPILLKQDGSFACNRADRDQVWLRHFGDQEYGQVLPISEFVNLQPETLKIDDELHWECVHLPSPGDIEAVLRQLPRKKAAGLDMVPGELLKAAPAQMAMALQPLMTKSAANLRQPVQWRGGLLFEAWKRSSSQREAAAYRSLYVASTVGKVYHKVMRRKVQGEVEQTLHDFHLGARKHAPVSMPALYVLAHQRLGVRLNLSTATLFLDTHAAYYRIVRDLAVGCIYDDEAVISLFKHFSLDEEDLQEMMSVVTEGGTFADGGIPSTIRHTAKDLHHFTWFVTPHTSGNSLCRTAAGSRPGESWADTVYAFIYGRVLNKIGEVARGEELAPVHYRDAEFGVYAQSDDGSPVSGQDATWADDSAWPIIADCPETLLRKASRLCSLVISQCTSHGMKPNFGRNKTALMFVLRGKGAVRAARSAFRAGKAALHLKDLNLDVPTTNQYRHLGGLIDHKTHLVAEARQRLAVAAQAFDKGQNLLYTNPTIPLHVRASLLQTSVTATFHNLAIWTPTGPGWTMLCQGYMRLVKRLLSRQFPGETFFRLPTPAALLITGCLPIEILARKARLSLLVSLCRSGPDSLWAVLQAEQSWLGTLRDDLHWLAEDKPDKWPKTCGAAWPEWQTLLTRHTMWFKRQTRHRAETELTSYSHKAALGLMLWALYKRASDVLGFHTEPTRCEWRCGPCSRSYKTKGALGAHFFKTHGRRAKYRAVVQGSLCAACGRQYWSTNRLARHLRDSPSCAATLRANRLFASKIAPGYGSRGWRKAEVDSFHPAVPQQQHEGLSAQASDDWDEVQKAAHLALCEVLLDGSVPETVEGLVTVVRDTVNRFPLYEEEAKHTIEFVYHEVKEVHDDLLDEGWTQATVQVVEEAFEQLLTTTWHSDEQKQRSDERITTLEDILNVVSETQWSEIWSRTRCLHGTPSTALYELHSGWEAEILESCRTVDVSAVQRHLFPVVPLALRRTWDDILKGGTPTLVAPGDFWGHPAAAPFAPLAAKHAP